MRSILACQNCSRASISLAQRARTTSKSRVILRRPAVRGSHGEIRGARLLSRSADRHDAARLAGRRRRPERLRREARHRSCSRPHLEGGSRRASSLIALPRPSMSHAAGAANASSCPCGASTSTVETGRAEVPNLPAPCGRDERSRAREVRRLVALRIRAIGRRARRDRGRAVRAGVTATDDSAANRE